MSGESLYPLGLPGPSKASWQVKDRARSAGLPGKALYSAAERDFSGTVDLEFFLSNTDAALWYDWWNTTLDQGGSWFTATWPQVTSSLAVYRFVSPPAYSHVYDGAYRVTVQAACRGKSRQVYLSGIDPYYNGSAGTDPYWNNVVAYLRGNGTNGSTTFVDSSGVRATYTNQPSSTSQISTAQSKFGGGSVLFNVTSSIAATANNAAYAAGSGDFTIECWVYRQASLVGYRIFNITGAAQIGFYTGTDTLGVIINASERLSIANFLGAYLNVWTHVCVERSAGTVTVYRNGVSVGSVAYSTAITGTNPPTVGGFSLGTTESQGFNGYIDEFRYTVGVARYGGAFTPPTAEFSIPDPRTVLLLHGETFTDSSLTTKTLTAVGSVAVSTTQKKYGDSSLAFNGTTDYITVTPVADFQFNAGDFTVEAWIYPTTVGTLNRYIWTCAETLVTNFAYMALSINGTTSNLSAQVRSATGGGTIFCTSTSTVALNTWQHVAMVRQGQNLFLFLGGVLVASSTTWATLPNAKALLTSVGAMANGYTDATMGRFAGYVDEVRLTNGAARYSANFTPHTQPHPDRGPFA